jgi:ABC-type transporter lipoprotein component MlaA/pimeloyl-ACP methyl ester carboxylesterase
MPPSVVALGILAACSPTTPVSKNEVSSSPTSGANNQSIYPDSLPDPLEPVNRGVWEINRGLLVGVVQPSSKVYRTVVPKPVRGSIQDFTRNITYPGRVVNHALQGRWTGAKDESLRFLCNTTAGVGGIFDVASKWNMPKSEANFGQTFTRWGWKPSTYIMLPLLGPSDESHALGLAADTAAEPWNYNYPYIYASNVSTYNKLSTRSEEAARFLQTDKDSYSSAKYLWTYGTKEESPDWKVSGPKDLSTLQTLGVILVDCRDPDFPERGRQTSVHLPSTGKNIKFNYWLQPTTAPLVFIAPGLSSHRLSAQALLLAESLYQNGYSVVTTTGIFHPEFMEQALTSALPAYPPSDSRDSLVMYTEIDRLLEKKYPGKIGKKALVGMSMGGFQALYLAAKEKSAAPDLLRFDRYVAVDSPINLHHGVKTVDDFYKATQVIPSNERQEFANNALHKAAKMAGFLKASGSQSFSDLPFNATESKFLIGLSFQLTLRDVIYSSQVNHDMGILKSPPSYWKREDCYREILNYSFRDYFLKFVIPYYQSKGVGLKDFAREANLQSYENSLRSQPKTRVIINRNDFLITPQEISWLQSTFGSSHLKIFTEGGHLGNLATEPVQKAILHSLDGLR